MTKLKIFLIIMLVIILIPLLINFYVVFKSSKYIKKDVTQNDYILVLGCAVKNGEPSLMLQDRLDKAIEIYQKYPTPIIISAQHSKDYSEVDVMQEYLLKHDVNANDIIRDDIGFSTSESLENFKNNFSNKSVIIVTQEYHLYRSLFIAEKLNIKAIGISSKKINYRGQTFRNIREILARNKDFLKYLFK